MGAARMGAARMGAARMGAAGMQRPESNHLVLCSSLCAGFSLRCFAIWNLFENICLSMSFRLPLTNPKSWVATGLVVLPLWSVLW